MATDPKHMKVCMYHPTEGAKVFDPHQLRDLDNDWRDTPYSDKEVEELATKGKKVEAKEIIEKETDPLMAEEEELVVENAEPTRLQFSTRAQFEKAHKSWAKRQLR